MDPESATLTTAIDKPYWQEGWLRQHDRLAEAIGQQEGWDVDRESLDAIDRLEPIHTTELTPAA